MKRILFINNTSMLGAGTSKSLLLIIKYLKNDFDLSVVSDKHHSDLPNELKHFSVKHYAYYDRTILFLPQLILNILINKVDIVYGNNYSGRSIIGFIASKITKRPFIWHIRESFHAESKPKFIDKAEKVLANSIDTANRIKKFTNVNDLIIIPNGVEITDFSCDRKICSEVLRNELGCAPNDILVINLGRICEQKNQIDVVNVAEKLLPKFSFVHFIFLGSFQEMNYFNKLVQRITDSNYAKNFHLIDFKKEFIPYLMGSDILLHTAKREPQGRVILEAMAAKLPVVAFDVGGVSEVLKNFESGFLREFGDINGVSEDLVKLIKNKPLREVLGEEGYKIVKDNYSAISTSQKIRCVINDLIYNRHYL